MREQPIFDQEPDHDLDDIFEFEETSKKAQMGGSYKKAYTDSTHGTVFFNMEFKNKLSDSTQYMVNYFFRTDGYRHDKSILQYTQNSYFAKHLPLGTVLFCSHCKQRSHPSILVDDKQDLINVQCRKCHTIHEKKDLNMAYGSSTTRERFTNFKYQVNGHLLSVTFKLSYATLYHNKIQNHFVNGRMTFNVETGQTYYFQLRENGKRWDHKENIKARFFPITYGSPYITPIPTMPLEFGKEIFNQIREMKKDLLGFYPMDFEEHGREQARTYSSNPDPSTVHFYVLTSYNRNPFIPHSAFRIFYSEHDPYLLRKMKTIKPLSKRAIQDCFDAFKVEKKKSYVRAVINNPEKMMNVFEASKVFTQPNNVVKSVSRSNDIFMRHDLKDLRRFFKEWIAQEGETTCANKFFGEGPSAEMHARDTLVSAQSIWDKDPKQVLEFSGNIEEIHDRFAMISRLMKSKPLPLAYPESFKKFNQQIDGYSFYLPDNSHDLVAAGSQMSICVGSYARRVFDKQCHVVLVKQKDRFVGSIELDSKAKNIIQAKAAFNKVLDENLMTATLLWANDTHLGIDTNDIPK